MGVRAPSPHPGNGENPAPKYTPGVPGRTEVVDPDRDAISSVDRFLLRPVKIRNGVAIARWCSALSCGPVARTCSILAPHRRRVVAVRPRSVLTAGTAGGMVFARSSLF
jgi:hypothetical protein